MIKAKTNKLVIILSVLLSAVFAFTVGYTFSNPALTITRNTDLTSVTAYLGNQDYTIINDSELAPINFGPNGHASEVAIQYSMDYDFNVRIQYSLSWIDNATNSVSSNANFDYVILNFVDRDNWFVDDGYIYHAGSISAGTGKLGIIGGVDFANPNDDSFYGLSLKINIDNVKIQASSSTTSMLVGSSPASDMYSAYLSRNEKNSAVSTAFVGVYNSLYDYSHGISHPNADTAYKKTMSGSTINSSSWLGGNRYYTGAGLHIITGTTAIKLKISLIGSWRQSTTAAPADVAPIDNITYNYSTDLTYDSANTDNSTFDNYYYNYIIPAKTNVYLEIADNVEITSMAYYPGMDYTGCKLITDKIQVNGTTFSGNKISTGTISSASVSAVTTNYATNAISIVNSSKYESNLFNSTSASGTQDYFTNIALVNNSKQDKLVTWGASGSYAISNGSTANTRSSATADFSGNTYVEISNSISSACTVTSLGSQTILVPAQSLIQVVAKFSITTATLNTQINTEYSTGTVMYDVWLNLTCSTSSIETSTSTSGTLTIETKIVESGSNDNIYVYVKNNSNRVATLSGLTLNLYETSVSISQVTSATEPSAWAGSYWNYYKDSSATIPSYYNGSTEVQNFSVPTYVANLYLKQVSIGVHSMSGVSMSYPATIKPYSIEKITFTVNSTESNYLSISHNDTYAISAYASATLSASTSAYISNNGTTQAKLVNNSEKQYLVKFNGTVSSQSNIYTANGYNYYLGVLAPNQIVELNMTTACSDITFVEITKYSSSSLASWDSTFVSRLTNLFK